MIVFSHVASAGPAPTCDDVIGSWKKIEAAALKDAGVDRNRIDDQVASGAKTLLATCKRVGWSAPYKRCLVAAKTNHGRTACFVDEYDRGENRGRCERMLDIYAPLADADFRPMFKDRDNAWIARFLDEHRETMRPWCIEHGMTTPAALACAKAAKTRAEFLACGGD